MTQCEDAEHPMRFERRSVGGTIRGSLTYVQLRASRRSGECASNSVHGGGKAGVASWGPATGQDCPLREESPRLGK